MDPGLSLRILSCMQLGLMPVATWPHGLSGCRLKKPSRLLFYCGLRTEEIKEALRNSLRSFHLCLFIHHILAAVSISWQKARVLLTINLIVLFIHSFLHSLIHSFIHSFIPSFLQSFLPFFVPSVRHSLTHSLTQSLIHSFITSFLRSFVLSFFHSSFQSLYLRVVHVQTPRLI